MGIKKKKLRDILEELCYAARTEFLNSEGLNKTRCVDKAMEELKEKDIYG